MQVSIVITTKNRLDDLVRTCQILRRMDPPPLDVIITADGCTDRTVEMLRDEILNADIPNLRVIVNETSK